MQGLVPGSPKVRPDLLRRREPSKCHGPVLGLIPTASVEEAPQGHVLSLLIGSLPLADQA